MKIYIVVSDTGSLLTKMIKLYTKDPYNHSSISLDKELTEMYSFGRKNQHNPFIGGYVNENIDSHLLRSADCEIYELDVTTEQYMEVIRQLDTFDKQRFIYRYNFIGLLAIILNIHYVRENYYFCSQFVSHVLGEANIKVSEKPFHYTKPNEFREYEHKKVVFKGNMTEYPYKPLTTKKELLPFRVYNRMHDFIF